jgi:hypothetical protein
MAEKTDPEKAYLSGYRDGYKPVMPTRREIDEMVNRGDKEARRAKDGPRSRPHRARSRNRCG